MEKLSRCISKIPEPFTLSMILTLIAILASKSVGDLSWMSLSVKWAEGLWSILGFAMQMVLVLATGFALAQAPIVEKRLKKMCYWPSSYAQGVALVAFVSLLLGMIHWGLGLAGGTLLVRQMRQVNGQRNFLGPDGLLGAAGYLPMMIWHSGLSGSAPLLVASPNHFLIQEMGTLSLAQTLGHWSNLAFLFLSLIVLPTLCFYWARHLVASNDFSGEASLKNENSPARLQPSDLLKVSVESEALAEWSPELKTPVLGTLIGLLGMLATVLWVLQKGLAVFGLNEIISLFLFLALFCHFRLGSFLDSFRDGVMASWSVVLLFPFYGAIMAIVKDSGLAAYLSEALAHGASASTLPLYTFISAGILNVFVPSGGGQWAIQGPIAVAAAKQMGVSADLMVMTVAYGDQLTNMLQPFWALPLLGMTKISAKELLRFTVPLMLVGAVLMLLALIVRA